MPEIPRNHGKIKHFIKFRKGGGGRVQGLPLRTCQVQDSIFQISCFCNAERLNFEKITELTITSNLINSHLGAVTEVQAQHHDKLEASADFALSRFPNAGILLLGDANELKLEYLCKGLSLKQVINIPTTKGCSSLDVICTNLHKSQPEALPPLGGSYNYILRMQPLDQIKVEYNVTETLHRPLTDEGTLTKALFCKLTSQKEN